MRTGNRPQDIQPNLQIEKNWAFEWRRNMNAGEYAALSLRLIYLVLQHTSRLASVEKSAKEYL